MRVFYVFKIKEEFKYLYKDNPSSLYNLLKQIYYLGSDDISYGENIFHQLTDEIDSDSLDRNLFIKLHKEIPYSKRDNVHIMNNLYKDEVSRLIVKRSYIKLETEQYNSSFFKVLRNYSSNYFICDFKNQTYFFLNDILNNDRPKLSAFA